MGLSDFKSSDFFKEIHYLKNYCLMEGVPERRSLDGYVVRELEKTSKLLNIALFLGLTSAVVFITCIPLLFGEIKNTWGELNEEISNLEVEMEILK